MAALTWLLIPLLTGLGAVVWACRAARPQPVNVLTDVERHERARAALRRTVPDHG